MKDRVDKNEIEIEYCPTHSMIVGFFTEPQLGGKFKRLKKFVMVHDSVEEFQVELAAHLSTKECVENPDKLTKLDNLPKFPKCSKQCPF